MVFNVVDLRRTATDVSILCANHLACVRGSVDGVPRKLMGHFRTQPKVPEELALVARLRDANASRGHIRFKRNVRGVRKPFHRSQSLQIVLHRRGGVEPP
jgi:hypothetical protein